MHVCDDSGGDESDTATFGGEQVVNEEIAGGDAALDFALVSQVNSSTK